MHLLVLCHISTAHPHQRLESSRQNTLRPATGLRAHFKTFRASIALSTLVINRYRYSLLQINRGEFRLLSLQPGSPSADIELEIYHIKQSSKPKYEALSYVCGPPELTEVVLVRSRPSAKPLSQLMGYFGLDQRNEEPEPITKLGITHNLGVALRRLRCLDKPRVLWVDAVCINQDDLVERSAEVVEMASIYSNAGRVVVWLGLGYDDSSLALQTLSKLGGGILYSSEQRELAFKKGSWAKYLQNHPEALVSNTTS
jgi:hypothetical protein